MFINEKEDRPLNQKTTSSDVHWGVAVHPAIKKNPEVEKHEHHMLMGLYGNCHYHHLETITDKHPITIATLGIISHNTRFVVAIFYHEHSKEEIAYIYEETDHRFYDARTKENYIKKKQKEFYDPEFQKNLQVKMPEQRGNQTNKTARFIEIIKQQNAKDGIVYIDGNFVKLTKTQLETTQGFTDNPRNMLIEGPPGTGKTLVAEHIIEKNIASNQLIYFVTPTDELQEKVHEELKVQLKPNMMEKIKVVSYKNLLIEKIKESNQKAVKELYVDESFFNDWLNKHGKQFIKELKVKDSKKIYEELIKVFDPAYLNNHNNIIFDEQDRKIIYKIFNSYRDHLRIKHKFDINMLAHDKEPFVEKKFFVAWIKSNGKEWLKNFMHINSKIDEELELIYDEFCNIEDPVTYLLKGSLSLLGSTLKIEDRIKIIKIYRTYIGYLNDQQKIDLAFQKIPFEEKDICNLMIFDEGQSASLIQLNVLNIAKNQIINMDPGQALDKQTDRLNIFLKQKLFLSKNRYEFEKLEMKCQFIIEEDYHPEELNLTTDSVIKVIKPQEAFYFYNHSIGSYTLLKLSTENKQYLSNLKAHNQLTFSPILSETNNEVSCNIYHLLRHHKPIKFNQIGVELKNGVVYYMTKQMKNNIAQFPLTKIIPAQHLKEFEINTELLCEHFPQEILAAIEDQNNITLDKDFNEQHIKFNQVYRNAQYIQEMLIENHKIETEVITSQKESIKIDENISVTEKGVLDFIDLTDPNTSKEKINILYQLCLIKKETFVIITSNTKIKNEVKKLFPHIPVLTSKQAQGSEFDNILSWNCFTPNNTLLLNYLLTTQTREENPIQQTLIKKITSDWRTSWSRAKKGCFLSAKKNIFKIRPKLMERFQKIMEENIAYHKQNSKSMIIDKMDVNYEQILCLQNQTLLKAIYTMQPILAKEYFSSIQHSEIIKKEMINEFFKRGLDSFDDEYYRVLLIRAIEVNDAEKVEELIVKGFNLSTSSLDFKVPLITALQSDNYYAAYLLITNNVNTNIRIDGKPLFEYMVNLEHLHEKIEKNKYLLPIFIELLKKQTTLTFSKENIELWFAIACKNKEWELLKILIENKVNCKQDKSLEKATLTSLVENIDWNDVNNPKNKQLLEILFLLLDSNNVNYKINKNKLLFYACTHGFVNLAQKLMELGANIDEIIDHYTAFDMACFNNQLSMIEFLCTLPNYARFLNFDNKTNQRKFRPLQIAIDLSNFQLAQLLLQKGAEVKTLDFFNGVQTNDLKMVDLLFEQGKFDVNEIYNSVTPMVQAANQKNSYNMCFSLIALGAKINTNKHNLVWMAFNNNNYILMQLFLWLGGDVKTEVMNVPLTNTQSRSLSILDFAHSAKETDYQVKAGKNIRQLVRDWNNPEKKVKLEKKIESDIMFYLTINLELLEIILRRSKKFNKDLYKKIVYDNFAHFESNSKQHAKAFELIMKHREEDKTQQERIRNNLLLKVSADPNNLTQLATLLKLGANPNISSEDEETPLYKAVKNNNVEGVKLLLKANANKHHQVNGVTPFMLAQSQSEELKTLMNEHEDNQAPIYNEELASEIFLYINEGNYKKILNAIEKDKEVVNLVHEKGTMLMHACMLGKPNIAQLFLNHGAKIDTKVGEATPLRCAIQSGEIKLVELLIQLGAAKEIIYETNNVSALYLAIDSKNENMVKMLLDKFTTIDIEHGDRSENGTPLLFAVERGLTAIVKILLDKGADINKIAGNLETTKFTLTPLIAASRSEETEGKKELFILLLNRNADLTLKDSELETALDVACGTDHVTAITSILEHVINNKINLKSVVTQPNKLLHATCKLDNPLFAIFVLGNSPIDQKSFLSFEINKINPENICLSLKSLMIHMKQSSISTNLEIIKLIKKFIEIENIFFEKTDFAKQSVFSKTQSAKIDKLIKTIFQKYPVQKSNKPQRTGRKKKK